MDLLGAINHAGRWENTRKAWGERVTSLRTATLDLTIFLKGQEITEINAKSIHNAYALYKFVNFCNLMEKTGRNTELCQKIDFRQTYRKFVVNMATSKMIDIQKDV